MGEEINRVRIVPRAGWDRGVRLIAVDENARGALQAAMDQRDQQAVAGKQDALFGFVREQMLVGGCKLGREDQRRLGRAEGIAGKGMLRVGEIAFQIRPERQGGTVIALGELEPPAFRERDPRPDTMLIPSQPRR